MKVKLMIADLRQMDNWGAYLNVPKQTWLPGSQSIPQPLVTGHGWHTLPHTLNVSSPRAELGCPPHIIQTFWIPSQFCLHFIPSWTLGLLALPFAPHLSPYRFRVILGTLPGVSISGYALPFINNKLSSPLYLEVAMSFLLRSQEALKKQQAIDRNGWNESIQIGWQVLAKEAKINTLRL